MQKTPSIKTSQVYLIFAISGATALIYQVLWSRWLGLVFGNTTTSVSIVLASFMSGLALGSWGAGRFLHRIANPMRVYASLELGIGLCAFCFPVLTQFTDFMYTTAVSPESTAGFSLLIKGALAFLLLLVPTTLMGATLPLLTDFFRRSPRHTGSWKVGLLYAANTLGAALGIIAAGFLLIELCGIFATTMTAAVLNLIIAFIAFLISSPIGNVLPEAASTEDRNLNLTGKLAVAVLTASGAAALASEVLWTRMIETLIGNSTYAFSMIVLLYLVGIAAGSWAMSHVVNRVNGLPFWLASIQMAMGIWVFIALFLFDGIIKNISLFSGIAIPLSLIFWNYLKVMIVLLPLSVLSGACFPLATRIIEPGSEDASGILISKAYAWNTAGAVVGSLGAGFLIAPLFDYYGSLYLLAFLYCLTAFIAFLTIDLVNRQAGLRRPSTILACIAAAALMAAAMLNIAGSNRFKTHVETAHPLYKVVYHKPGLQGVTTVIKKNDEKTANLLLVNGMGMTVKVTDTKMMAHLPMLFHPDPQDTLVICFGMGTTYRSAIAYGGNVTVVELVKEVFDAFDFFYDDAARVRSYPKGRMIVNDGRNFLKLSPEKFDVITIDPPPPVDAAGVNHLYSREFLEMAKSHLKKGGIMAHWIPFPGSRSGIDDMPTFNMLFQTFADVFPYVYMIRGYHYLGLHVLGSTEPLKVSMDQLKNRLSSKNIIDDITEWDPVPLAYFEEMRPFVRTRVSQESVTDNHPLLEFYLLKTWKQNGKKVFVYNYW
jgi:spermidine synthase